MNPIVVLCIIALQQAAPLSCRTVDGPHGSRTALHAERFPKREDNNIAELLIPLLEQSLDRPHDVNRKHNKKGIQVMPYESGEHNSEGWKKIKTKKKQLVEITPLRRKSGSNKPLAYILAAANQAQDSQQATNEDGSESYEEYKEEYSESDDTTTKLKTGSDEVAKKVTKKKSISTEDLQHDKPIEEHNFKQSYDDNIEVSTVTEFQSEEIVIFEPNESYKPENESGAPEYITDKSEDLSVVADSAEPPFGPFNNIIFGRGSSESEQTAAEEDPSVNIENRSKELHGYSNEFENSVDRAKTYVEGTVTSRENRQKSDEIMSQIQGVRQAQSIDINKPLDEDYSELVSSLRDEDAVNHGKDSLEKFIANNYELHDGKNGNPLNFGLDDIVEVIKADEEDRGKENNCHRANRKGVPWSKGRRAEHKSYRLFFLFNR